MPFDEQLLYQRNGMGSGRHSCYRIIAQGLGWVRVQLNDGMVPSKPATIDVEQFEAEFKPTTEIIESR